MPSASVPKHLVAGVVAACCFFAAGAGAATLLPEREEVRDCDAVFSFLNPRRRCEKDEPAKSQEYDLLVETLTWRIDAWKSEGKVSHVSVYFRDLQNGPLFNLNGQEHFAPASLLKVPVMMALYKYEEAHPQVMDERISLGGTVPPGQNVFDPDKTLQPDGTYTVREVLRRMIVYSDNSSKELLRGYLESLSPGIIDQTFIDLGISYINADGTRYITVKSYASLFRTLFNASFLDRSSSQEALALLAATEFDGGIVAGLPAGTASAHKFGYLEPADGQLQLHDCGVVYGPRTPYLLCVMTRGRDSDVLQSIIASVSRSVYEEVALRDAAL